MDRVRNNLSQSSIKGYFEYCFHSYMEGAVESGTRVALEVLNFIKPQSLTPHELKVFVKLCFS